MATLHQISGENYLTEISHRILPFQKTVLPFDHFAKKRRLLKSSDFCGDKISPFW
jgi:hypothetical protein